jgi:hypothetical protein
VPTFELGAGDKDLWRVIAKGLSKSPERRWAKVSDLGEALAFWLYDTGVTEDVCGNSLKTTWLGGTLAGLTLRPRADSSADLRISDLPPDRESRELPTLRLKMRRFRRQILQAATPRVLVGAGVSVALALILLLFGHSADSDRPPEPTAEARQVTVTNKKSGERAITEMPVAQDNPPIVAASAIPPVAASAAPKPAVKTYRAPARKKAERDYGL